MFPGRVGGAETYVRGLVGAFADGAGPELSTLLVSRHSGPAMEPFAGPSVAVRQVRSYRPGDSDITRLAAMAFAGAAPSLAARDVPDGLDLIHYPVTVPVPRVRGLPTVVSLFDIQHHDMPQLFSRAERAFRGWAYDGSARSAGEVITITRFSAERIVERLGIEPARVHPIHLGIDHSKFTVDGPPPAIEGLPERYVYYPANAWPHKNHERLVEAFSRVEDPELHLVLTGSGHEPRPDDERRRVVRLGHVPAEAIPGLYRQAAALVFPSLYEGFGFPPIEAMACGCPVAASNVGAVAEVCGDAALLFDPADSDAITEAITEVTSDQGLRERLRSTGLDHAARFTWAATAESHLSVYRQALSAAS
jgi:glycosyltransferase involved in cell wall biosynthesis